MPTASLWPPRFCHRSELPRYRQYRFRQQRTWSLCHRHRRMCRESHWCCNGPGRNLACFRAAIAGGDNLAVRLNGHTEREVEKMNQNRWSTCRRHRRRCQANHRCCSGRGRSPDCWWRKGCNQLRRFCHPTEWRRHRQQTRYRRRLSSICRRRRRSYRVSRSRCSGLGRRCCRCRRRQRSSAVGLNSHGIGYVDTGSDWSRGPADRVERGVETAGGEQPAVFQRLEVERGVETAGGPQPAVFQRLEVELSRPRIQCRWLIGPITACFAATPT